MENNEQTTPTPESTEAQSKPVDISNATQEMLDELTGLANRLTDLGRSWWNSDQRKQLETDLRAGAESVVTALEGSFKQVAESQEAKDLQVKAGEATEKVAHSKVVNDLATALKGGLQSLSAQLDKAVQEMERKSAASTQPSGEAGDSDAKDIPIDQA
jgi:hypothetical protein